MKKLLIALILFMSAATFADEPTTRPTLDEQVNTLEREIQELRLKLAAKEKELLRLKKLQFAADPGNASGVLSDFCSKVTDAWNNEDYTEAQRQNILYKAVQIFTSRIAKMQTFRVKSRIQELKMTGSREATLSLEFPEGVPGNTGRYGRNQTRGTIEVSLSRTQAVSIRPNDMAIISGKPYWSANEVPNDAKWYFQIYLPFRITSSGKLSRRNSGGGRIYVYLKRLEVDIEKVDFGLD